MRFAFNPRSGGAAALSALLVLGAPAALAQTPAKAPTAAALAKAAAAPPAPAQPAASTAEQIIRAARNAPAIVGDKAVAAGANFAKWGLTTSDFSLLDDAALNRKVASRTKEQLTAAADAGDVVAMYLAGVKWTEAGDFKKGADYIQRAAEKGVVRAISEASAAQFLGAAGDADRARGGYVGLRLSARTGSAASSYILARVMLATQVGRTWGDKYPDWTQEASKALLYSAQAGYSPSIFLVSKLAFDKLAAEGEKPELRRFAESNLAKAVSLGNAEAIAYQKQRAAAKKP